MRKYSHLCIYLLFIFIACTKPYNDGLPDEFGFKQDGVANVKGVVVDDNGRALKGITIKAGGKVVITDSLGRFSLNNCFFNLKHATISAEHFTYGKTTKAFMVGSADTAFVKFMLAPATISYINSATGGSTNSNLQKVELPANAVVNEDGSAFTGTIGVVAKWLDPSTEKIFDMMPGNLRGIDAAGVQQELTTFGMISVELYNNDKKLKLAPGKKAIISIPIPAQVLSRAPATIPMWHFDDSSGLWKEEGVGVKKGSRYEAEVSHFSTWNWDLPHPVAIIKTTVVDSATKQPQPFTRLKLVNATHNYTENICYTDAQGKLEMTIPANTALKLVAVNQCDGVTGSISFGPQPAINTTVNIGQLLVNPAPSLAEITGVVKNCAGLAVGRGQVTIRLNNRSYRFPVVNGSFTGKIDVCNNTGDAIISAVDFTSMQYSSPVNLSISGGTYNLGTINTCLPVDEFVDLEIGSDRQFYYRPIDDDMYCRASTNSSQHPATYIFVGNVIIEMGGTSQTASTANFIRVNMVEYYPYPNPNNLTGSFTSYGAVGGTVSGYFSGVYDVFQSSTPTNIVGAFKVVRKP